MAIPVTGITHRATLLPSCSILTATISRRCGTTRARSRDVGSQRGAVRGSSAVTPYHPLERRLPGQPPSRPRWRQTCGSRGGGRAAGGMSPTAGTHSLLLAGLWGDVVHNVVGSGRVATDAGGHMIQEQTMPRPPRDVVIGARAVAAHPDRAYQHAGTVVCGIESQTPAEDIDTPYAMPLHRIGARTEIRGRSLIGDLCVDGIAVLQAVQAAAG